MTISCIIMHHHAYLPAILTWMPIQKVGVAKAISMMPTGCSVYRRALHCKTAAWRGNGYRGCHGMSGDVRGAVQEPPFRERLAPQCSSTPWKGNSRYRYRMSQMNMFPHFVVLCTLNDYHSLFSIDYIMHHHASSCVPSSNLDLDAHSKGRCGKGNFHDANRMLRLQTRPPLQNRCLKRQWLGDVTYIII